MATGGKILREGRRAICGEVITDSGKVARGSVFVALKGERFDGHDFLKEAVERGAACLVVHKRPGTLRLKGATVIRVRDTLQTLGDMAHYCRKRLAPKVLAIPASAGS
ncbi:MAG: hypothetical protein HYY47_06425 [Deltaproteobacteria bacterium]|nr:hypothetical protein [Deltaproteobacteria bacterium]